MTTDALTATPGAEPREPSRITERVRASLRVFVDRPELTVLLIAAGLLYLWSLSANGMANQYYAATVQSMAASWHSFIYGSFDMAGVMTVDKPPLAFWVQALSVKVFGYGSLSMLVPQALMGVATVGLTYNIVDRRWGRWPALIGGATLALTPMAVAIFRHNNPDALLVLLSVAALWFVIRALEDGRTRWLLFAGAAIGAAFTTKMGAALLVIPALGAAYLWAAPVPRGRAFLQLLAGGGVMIAVAGAWPLLMALTPAASRPWISGTTDNSIWSLIVEYNGLGRINGQMGGPGGNGGGPGGGVFGGEAGIGRLFNSALGAQVSWLFGFAVASALTIAMVSKLRVRDPRTGWLVAVGGVFATCAIAFSFAKGIFHPYYTAQLAPFTAMLVGGGAGIFWSDRSHESEHDHGLLTREGLRWAAAGAILAGLLTALIVLKTATTMNMGAWQPLLIAASAVLAVVTIAAEQDRVRNIALASAIAVLLVAPAAWSVSTLGHATSGTFPAGGPAESAGMGGPGGGGPGGAAPGGAPGRGGQGIGFGGGPGSGTQLQSAIAYAQANGGGTIGVESQSAAAGVIAASSADVAGIGGFSGRESSVSVEWLAKAVADGRIRWIVSGGEGDMRLPGDGREGSTGAITAAADVCTAVELTSTGSNESTLYDCAGKADELAALAG